MDWADKSKLQIEKWLISARWYYLVAVLLVSALPWLFSLTPELVGNLLNNLTGDLINSLRPAQFPLFSLFLICLVINAVLDVWLHILERNWKLLKKISDGLATLSVLQIIFDLAWISAAIYLGQASPAVYPLFYFIPIVESIVLFSLWGPVLVAVLSAGLVTVLSVITQYGVGVTSLSALTEITGRLTEVITPSIAITIVYLVIGFFGAYLSGVVKERGELLARESSSLESVKKQGQALATQAKYQEQKLTANELELSLANQKLRALDESRSKFVAVTTHQMRTPLAGIKWTLSMLDTGQLGDLSAEAKNFVKQGLAGTEQLIHIVNDLLTVDRVDTGETEIKPAAVDPVELLDEVSKEFYNQAASRNINFSFMRPDWGVPKVMIDRAKIKIVLENLIDNAVKYSPTGGQVTMMVSGDRLNTAEPQLEISVADSGIGISDGDKGKVFHKFYRGAKAIAVEPDGSGVGLYICRDIIEKHGGAIWYEGRSGGGTVFHFTLPISPK